MTHRIQVPFHVAHILRAHSLTHAIPCRRERLSLLFRHDARLINVQDDGRAAPLRPALPAHRIVAQNRVHRRNFGPTEGAAGCAPRGDCACCSESPPRPPPAPSCVVSTVEHILRRLQVAAIIMPHILVCRVGRRRRSISHSAAGTHHGIQTELRPIRNRAARQATIRRRLIANAARQAAPAFQDPRMSAPSPGLKTNFATCAKSLAKFHSSTYPPHPFESAEVRQTPRSTNPPLRPALPRDPSDTPGPKANSSNPNP